MTTYKTQITVEVKEYGVYTKKDVQYLIVANDEYEAKIKLLMKLNLKISEVSAQWKNRVDHSNNKKSHDFEFNDK